MLKVIFKKYEMNTRKIKELINLEDRISSGKINQELVEQLGNLYRQFMEYCEYIREPLKLYFQEKLEYLYLNEKVAKMLIKNENRKQQEEIKVLSESFLNFSEIQESPVLGLEEYMSENNYTSEEKERRKELNLQGRSQKIINKKRTIK